MINEGTAIFTGKGMAAQLLSLLFSSVAVFVSTL
jgi:hypothetical protein